MAKPGGEHRRNTDNLRPPWKPGESGNPSGRPKGKASIVDALRRQLEQDHRGRTLADAVAAALIKRAVGGDVRAIKELIDRFDGPVKQQIEQAISRIEVEYINPPEDSDE